MSTSTSTSPLSGFSIGITPAGVGFASALSPQTPSAQAAAPTISASAAPTTPAATTPQFGDYDTGITPAQMAAAINADPNDTTGNPLVAGGDTLAQIEALTSTPAYTSAEYEGGTGSVSASQINYNGIPLSQLGLGQSASDVGQTLLGSGMASPGLTVDGQPLSGQQLTAAYNNEADSQESGDGAILGTIAAVALSCVAGPEVLAAYEGLGMGTALATVAAGATVGAVGGGITAAATGGSVGKGMLDGALTGAVGGGASAALGGAVDAGDISAGTSKAISGAASAATGSALNPHSSAGLRSVLTGAAIGAAAGGVANTVASDSGSNLVGGAAGAATSYGLNSLVNTSGNSGLIATAQAAPSTTASESTGSNAADPTSGSMGGFTINMTPINQKQG